MIVKISPKYKETLERISTLIKSRSKDISSKPANESALCYACRDGILPHKQGIEVLEKRSSAELRYYFHSNCYLDIMNS